MAGVAVWMRIVVMRAGTPITLEARSEARSGEMEARSGSTPPPPPWSTCTCVALAFALPLPLPLPPLPPRRWVALHRPLRSLSAKSAVLAGHAPPHLVRVRVRVRVRARVRVRVRDRDRDRVVRTLTLEVI